MRLLQTEIDVVPGKDPDRGARKEGFVGIGSAYLEIKNSTDRVNSYTIRVACDYPYWQAAWYQLIPMPPEAGDQNQPPKGKPDQPGAKNQSLKIHINREGVRKVLLAFKLPASSEARAGAYPIRIVVESVITDVNTGSGPPRITELPATLIVRPFFDWEVSFRPEDRKVGAIRRRGHTEVAVTNKGNDWLYLEFKKTPSQTMNLDAPVVRLAVPPPEPGQTFERSLPLTALTKLRTVRGDNNASNLPLAVVRVDAPTVPPLPEDVKLCTAANLGRSVIPSVTTETRPPDTPGTLTYCPPIPATLAGFLQAVIRNAKALAMLAVGTFLLFMGVTYLYEKTLHSINNVFLDGVQGDDTKQWDGQVPLVLKGDLLKPCVVECTFTDEKHPDDVRKFEINPQETAYKVDNDRPWYTAMTWGFNAPHYTIELTKDIQDNIGNASGMVKLTVARRFLFLGSLGMKGVVPKDILSGFHVGIAPPSTAQLQASPAFTALNPGDKIELIGSAFGKSPGGATATVGDSTEPFASWTASKITLPVPGSIQPGTSFSVVIARGGATIYSGQFSIKAPAGAAAGATPPAGAPDGSAPAGGAAPSTGGGGNAASNAGGPPPPGAAALTHAMASGAPSKTAVAALPASTAADHAVRAIGYYLSGDTQNGGTESDTAGKGADGTPKMNALLDAVYIAKELTNNPPSQSQIQRYAADISSQLGPNSALKLPYVVAAKAFQAVGDTKDAAAYQKLGGG